jgi:hypothetical protein
MGKKCEQFLNMQTLHTFIPFSYTKWFISLCPAAAPLNIHFHLNYWIDINIPDKWGSYKCILFYNYNDNNNQLIPKTRWHIINLTWWKIIINSPCNNWSVKKLISFRSWLIFYSRSMWWEDNWSGQTKYILWKFRMEGNIDHCIIVPHNNLS